MVMGYTRSEFEGRKQDNVSQYWEAIRVPGSGPGAGQGPLSELLSEGMLWKWKAKMTERIKELCLSDKISVSAIDRNENSNRKHWRGLRQGDEYG